MRRIAPAIFATAVVTLCAPPLVHAQSALVGAAAQTLVTAAGDSEYTLAAGSRDGIVPGTVYGIVRRGRVRARLLVTQSGPQGSTAHLIDADDKFKVTVGDTARFLSVDAPPPVVQLAVAPEAAAANSAGVAAPQSTPPVTAASPPGAAMAPAQPNPAAASDGSGTQVLVTAAVDQHTLTLGAGTAAGIEAGTNFAVWRNGKVIAIAHATTALADSTTATIVWQDAAAGGVAPGDLAHRLRARDEAPAGAESLPITAVGAPSAAHARARRGYANTTVPRADRAYSYLAALAAQGLITSQPAWIFADDGILRHRTAEDITFTRRQIADLISEAMASPRAQEASSTARLALRALTLSFRPELLAAGRTSDALDELTTTTGVQVGFSGQAGISLASGDTAGYLNAFSERQGGLRSRSGLDLRGDLFGTIGDKIEFSASLDADTDVFRGGNQRNYSVRRALLAYDAGSLLKGLRIEMGRQEYWWGPGHFGTTLLSDSAGPLDSLHTVLKRGSTTMEGLYAPLGNDSAGNARSLYAHKLETQLGGRTRLGLAESAIMPTKSFDPVVFAAAVTPFPLILAERISTSNEKSAADGNVLSQAYLESNVAPGASVYGELLVDDLIVGNNNGAHNRIGTVLGAHLFAPDDATRLGLYAEYARLSGRTYLRYSVPSSRPPGYDYYYRGSPLGYAIAPLPGPALNGLGGADSLRLDAYWKPRKKLHLGLGVELAKLNSDLPAFSRQRIIRADIAYDIARNTSLVARAQHIATTQPNFVVGEPSISQKLFDVQVVRAF